MPWSWLGAAAPSAAAAAAVAAAAVTPSPAAAPLVLAPRAAARRRYRERLLIIQPGSDARFNEIHTHQHVSLFFLDDTTLAQTTPFFCSLLP